MYADPLPASLEGPRWLLRRVVCGEGARSPAEVSGELLIERSPKDELALWFVRQKGGCRASILYAADTEGPCTEPRCGVVVREKSRVVTGPPECAAGADDLTPTLLTREGASLTFKVRSRELCGSSSAALFFDAARSEPPDEPALVTRALMGLAGAGGETLEGALSADAKLRIGELGSSDQIEVSGRDRITAWLENRRTTWARIRITELSRTDGSRVTASVQRGEGETPARFVTHFVFEGGRITSIDEVRRR